MTKLISLGLYLTVIYSTFSQSTLEGVLLDQNGEPIPFATIGIFELSIGTISNEDGSFALQLDDSLYDRKITFSAIGYDRKSISIQDLMLMESIKIKLSESITSLEEVVVSSSTKYLKRIRMVTKGNFLSNTGTMRLDRNQNGGAMALLVEHDNIPYWVSKVKLRIRHNSLEQFKVRVRFMGVDSVTGKPTDDLISKDLIYESDIKSGWLKYDLTEENIWLKTSRFFIVFEWIMDKETRVELQEQLELHLSQTPDAVSESTASIGGDQVNERMIKDFDQGVWFATLLDRSLSKSHKCYYRLNSLDDWKPSLPVLAAEVLLSDYKN